MANDIWLTFDFELPPTAEDLGEVFAALSRDYRDMSNGGTLVVSRVESGSILVSLTDTVLAAAPSALVVAGGAISTMAAINTIDKFADTLKKWFGKAKTAEGKKRLYRKGKKQPGQRSVEAIIKTAAKTRSTAKVKYTKANGDVLEAEIAPAEAIEIQEAAAANAEPQELLDTPARALKAIPSEIESAVEKLRVAGRQNLSHSQIEAIVDVIVAALQSAGAGHTLPEIASQLETHGMFDFADAVRKHIRGSGGTLLPITTL